MPLSAAARALAARCRRQVNDVARRVTRDDFESLPGYPALPDDMKDVEIAATVRHGVRMFLEHADSPPQEDGTPRRKGDDHAFFRERAAQRAEEGMELHLLLRSHLRAAHVLSELLRDNARPGEEAALAELSSALLSAQEDVVGAVTESYLQARAALSATRRARHEALARDLLGGSVPDDRTLGALGLTGPVSVLVLHLPRTGEAPWDPVTAYRTVQRIRTALNRVFGSEVLGLFDEHRGYAIVPGSVEDAGLLARTLAGACGTPGVHCAVAEARSPGGVSAAARTAEEVLGTAMACGRPFGVHRLDDVLLEHHLSGPSESGSRIAALLAPVADRPELTGTVRVHLEHGRSRKATAHRMGVHPNTVDNRLARFAELTGIDVSTDRGAMLALAAWLLRERSSSASPPDGPSGRGAVERRPGP